MNKIIEKKKNNEVILRVINRTVYKTGPSVTPYQCHNPILPMNMVYVSSILYN